MPQAQKRSVVWLMTPESQCSRIIQEGEKTIKRFPVKTLKEDVVRNRAGSLGRQRTKRAYLERTVGSKGT